MDAGRVLSLSRPGERAGRTPRSELSGTLAADGTFRLHGDGSQSRDFTYVTDAVDATVRSAAVEPGADVYNVGGGEQATMSRVVELLEASAGRSLHVERTPPQRGDVSRTSADVSLARDELGWSPAVPLDDGLARQYAWVRDRRRVEEVVA